MRSVSLAVGSDSLIRNIMEGKSRSPRAENLEGIAAELFTTTKWLLKEEGPEEVYPSDTALQPTKTSSELSAVPVRGIAAGSHERGAFQFTGDDIDFVERPAALAGVRNLFAVYIVNDSMYPEHKHGDLRFVAPDRPARPGDTVLIEARDDPEHPEWAMIGNLISRGADYVIGKLNPENEVQIPRGSVIRMHKVLTQNELFGK